MFTFPALRSLSRDLTCLLIVLITARYLAMAICMLVAVKVTRTGWCVILGETFTQVDSRVPQNGLSPLNVLTVPLSARVFLYERIQGNELTRHRGLMRRSQLL